MVSGKEFFLTEALFAGIFLYSRAINPPKKAESAPTPKDTATKQQGNDANFDIERPDSAASGDTNIGLPKKKHTMSALYSALKPERRGLAVMTLCASLWTLFAFFCLACWLAKEPERMEKEGFYPNVEFPLFFTAVVFFFSKMAEAAQYKAAVRLGAYLHTRRVLWPVRWIMCTFWMSSVMFVGAATLDPLMSRKSSHILPGMRALVAAYDHSLWAKMCYWALLSVMCCGAAIISIVLFWMKVYSGTVCLVSLYTELVEPALFRFVVEPVTQYTIRPLLKHILNPPFRCAIVSFWEASVVRFWKTVILPPWEAAIGLLSGPIRQYLLKPLANFFPGPQTKTEHLFLEPGLPFLVIGSISGSAFITFTSIAIFTASEEDTSLMAQKNSINLLYHLAVFYSVTLWLVWRGTSALNFAPSIRLDSLVYKSRMGWVLQSLFCAMALYSLWKISYFAWVAYVWHEGVAGRALDRAAHFGSFSILGIDVNIIGIHVQGIFYETLKMGAFTAFIAIAVALFFSVREAAGI
ncbi:hypothetical protein NQ176_g8034 [Zarea fungicola]|uniref:Uncharacterized protein n=1 Tax=Zarea fungicola TaxID=93591 RepID=A0ACC1MV96_9HYPO|nr:hypothetical protein NQ176_g8034 [Lecanicillium fungicola]